MRWVERSCATQHHMVLNTNRSISQMQVTNKTASAKTYDVPGEFLTRAAVPRSTWLLRGADFSAQPGGPLSGWHVCCAASTQAAKPCPWHPKVLWCYGTAADVCTGSTAYNRHAVLRAPHLGLLSCPLLPLCFSALLLLLLS